MLRNRKKEKLHSLIVEIDEDTYAELTILKLREKKYFWEIITDLIHERYRREFPE